MPSENTSAIGSVLTKNRWSKYVAASAAGAAATLGAQEAAQAYTVIQVNTTLEDRTQGNGYFDVFGPYTFGGAGASFQFQQAFNETGTNVGQLTLVGTGNITFAGFAAGAYFYPSNLAYGAVISAQNFGMPAGVRGDMAWGAGYTNSQFLTAGVGYVAFRFDLGAGTQYGWAQVDLNGAPDNRGTFIAYGYGAPGEAVTVGQPIPEPSSLAMLALGGLGLMAWRRKRAAAK